MAIERHGLACLNIHSMSTGERPFIDIIQDRRYWIIHIITIPSLYIGGVTLVFSGFVYTVFGVASMAQYFNLDNTALSIVNDRFSLVNELEDL